MLLHERGSFDHRLKLECDFRRVKNLDVFLFFFSNINYKFVPFPILFFFFNPVALQPFHCVKMIRCDV